MFLKNKNIIYKIKRSKVTDYAVLIDPDKKDWNVVNGIMDANFRVKRRKKLFTVAKYKEYAM